MKAMIATINRIDNLRSEVEFRLGMCAEAHELGQFDIEYLRRAKRYALSELQGLHGEMVAHYRKIKGWPAMPKERKHRA